MRVSKPRTVQANVDITNQLVKEFSEFTEDELYEFQVLQGEVYAEAMRNKDDILLTHTGKIQIRMDHKGRMNRFNRYVADNEIDYPSLTDQQRKEVNKQVRILNKDAMIKSRYDAVSKEFKEIMKKYK